MSSIMNPGDKVSTMLGAPPQAWTKTEQKQMQRIHRRFEEAQRASRMSFSGKGEVKDKTMPFPEYNTLGDKAYNAGQHDVDFPEVVEARNAQPKVEDGEELGAADMAHFAGKDPEDYLHMSSPLRSKNGEMKAPANCPWKSQDDFEKSLSFAFWRDKFTGQGDDSTMKKTASAIVQQVCSSQDSGSLRVKGGKVPLRKKREQITPLALMLHEIKLWATNFLTSANVFEETTFEEIAHRRRYIEAIVAKEVWGDAKNSLNVFGAGMDVNSHKALFNCMMNCKGYLDQAYTYAKRQYATRSSREKLKKARDALKDVLFDQIKLVASLLTFNQDMNENSGVELNPIKMFNPLNTQHTVDYGNIAVIAFYKLLQVDGVRGVFETQYQGDLFEFGRHFENWLNKNLFIGPSVGADKDVFYKFDETIKDYMEVFPEFYAETVKEVNNYFDKNDKKRKQKGVSAKKQGEFLKKAFVFGKEKSILPVKNVMKYVMKALGSLQNLIPIVYLVDVFYDLAGSGGDLALYDDLKEYVIETMIDAVSKVEHVKATSGALTNYVRSLATLYGKMDRDERQRKRKALGYNPNWINNYKFVETRIKKELITNAGVAVSSLVEIAQDAWSYELDKADENGRKERTKDLVGKIVVNPGNQENKSEEPKVVVNPGGDVEQLREEVQKAKDDVKKKVHAHEGDFGGEGGMFAGAGGGAYGGFDQSEEETTPPNNRVQAWDPNYDSDESVDG
eukprot:snap_masked-scaffold_28-processed-gene-3.18-mRNA-1 protein AED:0.14 eAED:1.00 QI:0/-1/0/1/-1/1/1/0/731